jgi:hypothetical protein
MKLLKAKMEYTCGTTIIDQVWLNVQTLEVLLPPRLTALMHEIEKTEPPPAFSIEYNGRSFAVTIDIKGSSFVKDDDIKAKGKRSPLLSFVFPSKDQRLLNGRFAHMLSVASLVGALVSVISVTRWNIQSFTDAASYLLSALLLGAAGFYCKKED